MNAPPPVVLYESEQTPLAWKVVVAAFTGLGVVGAVAFLRWFERAPDLGFGSPASLTLGATVACAMTLAALRSRVVRRVEIRAEVLHLARDPGVVDAFPFSSITTMESEAPVGGWSRDPAEVMVLRLRDARVLRYVLPDDADTPAIVRDFIEAHTAVRPSTEIEDSA